MAKKISNFRKFGKLASLVKKVADKNPELKEKILAESTSTSKNNWNKIQKWTSKNLFPKFKDKPLKEFTKKNVEQALKDEATGTKPSKCFNVFKVPTADLGDIDPFDLAFTLQALPPNLQVKIALSGGEGSINTGVDKIENIPSINNGELTKGIRELYPDIEQIRFVILKKKGLTGSKRTNCDYFVQAIFQSQNLSDDESNREVEVGVNVGELSEKQQSDRLKRKKELEAEKRKRKSKAQKRKFKTPDKVKSVKEDKEIKKKVDDDIKTKRIIAFEKSLERLENLLDKKLITKKQFRESFDKLTSNLKKGGIV